MSRYNYDRLTAQDNSFLLFETHHLPMHVSSALVFDSGPLRTPEGGVDMEAIRRATAGVLHRIPRYRQKLHWIPFDRHAVWVDDPRFQLDFHLRHTALPRPGSGEQLKRLCARIMAQPLDRARPLWETWVVEGVDGGARFALVTKIHHCMIDGSSGVDLAHILLSPSPDAPPPPEVPEFVPRPAPSRAQLLLDETTRRLALPLHALRAVRDFARQTADLRDELEVRGRALLNLARTGTRADATPMNGKVGPHRRFDWLDVPLDGLKAMRRALGCTINDLVLAAVTGAVREYLLYRGVHPERVTFRVSAPVSIRSEAERGRLGNRVSSWIVPLPIAEPDPRRQLAVILHQTQVLKETRQALGVEMMMGVAEWTPSILLSLGARAMSGPVNTIVTNVPGPQIPLYLQGARLRALYPQAPLLDGMGLAVGLVSYDGRVHWGIVSDPDLVPDADVFTDLVAKSLRALAEAAGLAPDAAAPGAGAPVPSVH
ncbi:MAG TPA: wax ester/triacylglycerol synthase family O-acyltransferase [Myxococcota bacterium]|nr:wax ester/triacylglycerol synthase family O-acyltransferase [Myxococcota bacterium]